MAAFNSKWNFALGWQWNVQRFTKNTLVQNLFCSLNLLFCGAHWGSLHVSPVNRAGSDSKISPRHSFIRKNFDVSIWEAGLAWVTGTKPFRQNSFAFASNRPKRHNFCLVCIYTLGVCELPLLATTAAKGTSLCLRLCLCSPFWLVVFLVFHPGRSGWNLSYEQTTKFCAGNRASPVTGNEWMNEWMKFYLNSGLMRLIRPLARKIC